MYEPVSRQVRRLISSERKYETCAFVERLAAIINRPPRVVANVLISFTGLVLLLNPGGYAPLLSQLLTFTPGLWGTLKCWQDDSPAPKWLNYWVVFSGCVAVESSSSDLIQAVFPLWWLAKVAGLYWMLSRDIHSETKEKHRPDPLTLKTKPTSTARRPSTPIAEPLRIVQHEPLPSLIQPEPTRLVHSIPRSIEPRYQPNLLAAHIPASPVPGAVHQAKGDSTLEPSPSPPFELSPDGSLDSLELKPQGDLYFDDLTTAVELPQDDMGFASGAQRNFPAESPFAESPDQESSTTEVLEQPVKDGLGVDVAHPNQDLDASLDDLLQLASEEDGELDRTGDEEEAKGNTKPLSLFEKRVRLHNTLTTEAS